MWNSVRAWETQILSEPITGKCLGGSWLQKQESGRWASRRNNKNGVSTDEELVSQNAHHFVEVAADFVAA